MSTDVDSDLVVDDAETHERIGTALATVSVSTVFLGVLLFAQVVGLEDTLAGVAAYRLLGGLFVLVGLAVVGLGAASHRGLLATDPDFTAGAVPGVFFMLVGLVAGGLVASQTLGLSSPVLWLPAGLVAGVALGALTVLPREDLGSTLPTGLLSVAVGAVVLADVLGPGWSWNPAGFDATFPATLAVPVLATFTGLVVAWTGARANEGFGTRGKQAGAYLLVTMNAAGMVALLGVVLWFIASRGWQPATRGIEFALYTGRWWFHVPLWDRWVIVHGVPGVWFYWPFAMEGVALTNDINGVAPAIIGTAWVVIGAVTFAVPLGVGSAIFLTEYAEQGEFTRLVEVSTNSLWSTPSIVYGLFGLAFLVPRLGNNSSILAGQLVLGFMLLPLVVITSREAIKNVPDEYRDASAALGVSKWETIKSVVVPAAMPGVITGVILGVGRIAGETAPLLLVMADSPTVSKAPNVLGAFEFTAQFPFVTNDALLQSSTALPYQLYALISAGVEKDVLSNWGTAFVLLLVVMSFYAVGIASRIYFRRKLQA
jgi:phosphate transport system permease protein